MVYSESVLEKIRGKSNLELIEIAKNSNRATKEAILDNCDNSRSVYAALSKDPDPKVRIAVANRCVKPKHVTILIGLTYDKDFSVRAAAERRSYQWAYEGLKEYRYH